MDEEPIVELSWFHQFIVDIFSAVLIGVLKVVLFLADSLLAMLNIILDLFDTSIFDPGQYFEQLDPAVLEVISLLGFSDAMAIIVAAVVLRIVLQLIPFTRLGS
jgi:hypothetical protein